MAPMGSIGCFGGGVLLRTVSVFCLALAPALAQLKLRPPDAAQAVTLLPSDMAILEAGIERKDLPCTVSQHKPELGFDLHFHAGYDVSVPIEELAGAGNLLTIVFRVYPENDKSKASFFVQHYNVPQINDDAKGTADLQGVVDLGEGRYHVDWLMRDRSERFCTTSWDMDAELSGKDKPVPLFLKPDEIAQALAHPFVNEPLDRPQVSDGQLNLKILVNFAPQWEGSAAFRRMDADALVTILKSLERDPHVGRIALVAFNINQSRVFYRQDAASEIDFPALGKALDSLQLGTVNLQNLGKNTEAEFLEGLIEAEVASPNSHPDAVIFAGPKAMLQADVPQEDLRRIGTVECPVFYLNYNPDPQAVPWKDSISHAIRVFRGMEYTITRPRDVWTATTDVLSRILHSKRNRTESAATEAAARDVSGQSFR